MALQHLNAQRGVTRHAVMRRNVGNDLLYALHDRLETELRRSVLQAITRGLPHLLRQPCALDQGLAGHAAVVQAVATHLVCFNQSDFGFHSRCDVGRHQAASARADDDQVAVKLEWPLALPACVDFAPLHQRQALACGQRQQTEHGKRAQDGGREHASQ